LTGTAAWNFVALSQHLLGVRPDFEGLRVSPVISKELATFTVTRKCRGAEYVVRVTNAKGGTQPPKLTVNGKAIEGNQVPYAPRGARVVIDCEV
jgi:cellobiose phosphorylase